jgi:uncharacterized protein YdeI (YjbR/CyaY-like superfamily)
MDPIYFDSPALFRQWLARNSRRARELWVGYYKAGTAKQSMRWPESVDQALCFGWIDGIRRRIDADRYTIRFTPRKSRSVWSLVNTKRLKALTEQGLVKPAGREACESRRPSQSGVYSYEQRPTGLPAPYLKRLAVNRGAARFFAGQAPSYRKAAIWWVVSGKRESTRLRRLDQLIEDSAYERRIKQFISRRADP